MATGRECRNAAARLGCATRSVPALPARLCLARRLRFAYTDPPPSSFDILGTRSDASLSLLPALSNETVIAAALSRDSLAAVCAAPDGLPSVHLVDGLTAPHPERLPETGLPPGARRPTCVAIIDADRTDSGRAEVLLGSPEGGIVSLRAGAEARYEPLPSIPHRLAVSASQKYVAAFCEDATLTAYDIGFATAYFSFDTKAAEAPSDLAWCGEDAVALAWGARGVLLLVGPGGDDVRLDYDEPISLVSETDGVRIAGARGLCELVTQVPAPLVSIRAIGATTPSALLLDAHAAFAEGDARCDDAMRELCGGEDASSGEALGVAVAGCLAAALSEWEPLAQAGLLKAAAYGKAFDPGAFPRDALPDAARTLRVLNTLRDAQVGLPLSAAQLAALTPRVLIERLLARHRHRLALALAGVLGLPTVRDRVLVHWACAKVKAGGGVGDSALAALITQRLAGVAAVSYADIAAAADAAGRRVLATLLLDREPRAADRVPILLRMREPRLALEKALDAGEADLVHLSLAALRREGGGGEIGRAHV